MLIFLNDISTFNVIILNMENKTNLVPKRLDQVFLTEITKNESKVRFNESYTN